MARFDDELIRQLKEETDIVRLIESYGTKLKPRPGGEELIGLCPIHDDTSPSLVVNRKKNVWNCLGACGCGGDVIEWVMHADKVSFRHAVELLKDGATGSMGGAKCTTGRRLDAPVTMSTDDRQLLAQVANYYHQRLKESPSALTYLQKRGITDSEVIERFKIGFSDRTLGLRLPRKNVKAGKELRGRLHELGVIKETGHELLRGCVTFPILLEGGGVGEIYGRRVDSKPSQVENPHFYLPGPHVGVWNEAILNATDEVILCESIIDALTFWCAGYRNVTASYGKNGFTDDMLQAFVKYDIRRVLIAYDNDDASNPQARKLAETLAADGFEAFRIVFPKGMDANEYALKVTPASQSLGLVIRNAQWLGGGNAPTLEPTLNSASKDSAAKEETVVEAVASNEPPSEANDSERHLLAANASATDTTAASDSEQVAAVATLSAPPVAEEPQEKQEPQPREEQEKQPPIASPQPPAQKEVEATIKENGIVMQIGNRTYRVRGLERNLAFDILKLNVMVRRDERFFVDTFDLYAARTRSIFIKETSRELGFDEEVIKRDLGKVLLKLESLQDQQIQEALAVKEDKIELSDKDKQAAFELLKSPNLIQRILKDFERSGMVGEETNKLVGYLAATSRKLEKPLAVVIQSSSAAGKSALMDAILRFVPPEEQVGYSAMTGQSLFYMGGMQLKHKILSIAEEEGVAQASYALKLLQSEGELTIASTGKDPGTGRMETQEYHVEGPVMIFLTTTAIDIDEELVNRCVVLTVDENREQTRAIHHRQRHNETLEGLLASQQCGQIHKLHQDAQRLLRPLLVVNPYAGQLAFVDDVARRRRDHMKYLTLIRSITLLHQYQRKIQTVEISGATIQYIEVTLEDIVLANRLANQVLGKSIDELPPQTRRLLLELYDFVRGECQRLAIEQNEYRFTRRLIREQLGWGQTQLKLHLDRLLEMEYVLTHRNGGRRLEYELLYDGGGREGQPTMCGLIDVSKLTGNSKPTEDPGKGDPGNTSTPRASSGSNGQSSGAEQVGAPQDRPIIGPLSGSRNGRKSKRPKR